MDVRIIRDAMRAQPFRPFSLRLADGRELTVPHPDFISVAPDGWSIVVWSKQEPWISTLEPALIVSLEKSTADAIVPGTNGSAAPNTGS